MDKQTNRLNVRKFYETLAKIIGDREGVEITVAWIRERETVDSVYNQQATGTA